VRSGEGRPRTRSVLVIDDDDDIGEIIKLILSDDGYEVRTSSSGREGLALAEISPPDLVIMDWQMPVMSGPEILERLKASPRLREIPVLLMSAGIGAVPAELLRKHKYLPKPFDIASILESVSTFF